MRIGVVRGISYGLFGKPDQFVPQARQLGAGLIRAYLFWGQIEPEPGRYDWSAADALLDQCVDGVDVWLTVCSSSPWATRVPTDFLPPSPALDPRRYGAFVRRLVRRFGGRVRYWQCDNEPSNTGLLWSGTAAEYVEQLRVMYQAVKEADPVASVVLGGCGYDMLGSAPNSEQRRFFDEIVAGGRDAFDVFDIHLYGPPERIPEYVATARRLLAAHGADKPIVAGEHGGPVLFEFPEVEPVLQDTMMRAYADVPATQSIGELRERAAQETPERRAMRALYEQMPQLPPRLQMLMAGCPPQLEAQRHRINACQIAQRTVLALAEGITVTAYWNLAPEVPGPSDPYQLMHLLFGKLPLLDYRDGELGVRHPAADAFALVAHHLHDATGARRLDAGPVAAFGIDRDRGPLLVAWAGTPATVTLAWPAANATAVDVFGAEHPAAVTGGEVRFETGPAPVFVTAG
ncbi:hypothetical protein [Dactylosporangium sp. CA-139066]|uniref:hypothetical protein n=1 Tax=Dactylosporangium sp. CA-139066 TaxID=3239930 RepID=UPI003D94A40A